MKKVLITMAVLTGLVAGGMVFSSFAAPKQDSKKECTKIEMNDGWTRVGDWWGYTETGRKSDYRFVIWERKDACNSYYWVYLNYTNSENSDPDHTKCTTGVLRQNYEKKWYANVNGTQYFINF